jgi:hypothetical protein
MADKDEDENLADFFESVLHDQTEKQILKLILEGKEGDLVIEEMLKASARDEKNQSSKQGKRA